MGNNFSTTKINGVNYTYSSDVQAKTRRVIQSTISDVQQKCSNNSFFEGLDIDVYSSWKESSKWQNIPDTKKGLTTYPIFDKTKNIYLQTDEAYDSYGGILNHYTNYSQIKENTLHELGHIFDYNFATPNPEVVENLQKIMNLEGDFTETQQKDFDKLLAQYKKNNGLSDSEKFKQAWKSDVEKAFKGHSKIKNIIKNDKLGYFSPTYEFEDNNNYKKIILYDGINDTELELSDRAREEIFAQLFAYALGANSNINNKKTILSTYKNSYEVVKEYVKKYLNY